MRPQKPDERATGGVEIAVVLLTAFVLGVGAGVLCWIGGAPVAMSILTGAGAFGGITLFILAVLRAWRSGS